MFRNADLIPDYRIGFEVFEKGKRKKGTGTFAPVPRGAFPFGSEAVFRLEVPRLIGAMGVVLRLAHDEGECVDLPLTYLGHGEGFDSDVYSLCLNRENLPPPPESAAVKGLYYYEFLFLRGEKTLFSDTPDNTSLLLSAHNARRFHLLFYDEGYSTPKWFYGGVMYHIFADRFCRGEGETALHLGAVLNEDWQGGIPQYAEKRGGMISNTDFFGGNLWGICEKIEYLASLGVTVLYLSPIFRAKSNHRYDTGDYEEIDSLLGGKKAFDRLISLAHARGMRVILDGVFNHTGDDSRYFNRYGTYPDLGAYQSQDSAYADWYSFRHFPDDYECWWNIPILPRLNQTNPATRDYFCEKIARMWLKEGADGWRLDVADELDGAFLEEFRKTVKEETNGDGLILGEVWENAADKIAYGKRRSYFGGKQLDGVMNYPLRNAVLALLTEKDAGKCAGILKEIEASYPAPARNCLMNLLGTHDTERILTLLGDGGEGEGLSPRELSVKRLTEKQREKAICLLEIASAVQFTVPGVPSVYYGDEAGTEGYHDPFCRMPFPWGREDERLLAHYRRLGALRSSHICFAEGEMLFGECGGGLLSYLRKKGKDGVLTAVNIGEETEKIRVPGNMMLALSGGEFSFDGKTLTIGAESYAVLETAGK